MALAWKRRGEAFDPHAAIDGARQGRRERHRHALHAGQRPGLLEHSFVEPCLAHRIRPVGVLRQREIDHDHMARRETGVHGEQPPLEVQLSAVEAPGVTHLTYRVGN